MNDPIFLVFVNLELVSDKVAIDDALDNCDLQAWEHATGHSLSKSALRKEYRNSVSIRLLHTVFQMVLEILLQKTLGAVFAL